MLGDKWSLEIGPKRLEAALLKLISGQVGSSE
jgi:hypothetical protein